MFGILVVLLCLDWIRSSRKAEKEEKRHQLEMETMREKKVEAQKRIEALAEETARLKAMKEELEKELGGQKPDQPKKPVGPLNWFQRN